MYRLSARFSLALVLILIPILGTRPVAAEPAPASLDRQAAMPWSDVDPGNPFYFYILSLAERHIVDGYADNMFRPFGNASRATLASWVVRIQGWTSDLRNAPHFADVPPTDPRYSDIETAYNHGVLGGYSDGTFRPDNDVTRGQMSKMIVNAQGWAPDTGGGPHFRDVDDHNPFYDRIETIYNHGLVSGYDCGPGCLEFRWGNSNTRGQLAKVLFNTLPPAARALDRANFYRDLVGLPLYQLHPALLAAAQNHVTYFLLNHNDPAAMLYGPHGEVAGKPGYTGRWPSDRIAVAGFPWVGGAEVMHFLGDPLASVDGWLSTVYHRVLFFDSNSRYIGYANGVQQEPGAGGPVNVAVDVVDFGNGPPIPPPAPPYVLAYPADLQTGVPATGGDESPSPVPPGAHGPFGYPFTLQGTGGPLYVSAVVMRDGGGRLVAVYSSSQNCSCYAVIAQQPLQPNTTYSVHVQGTVGTTPFDRTWHFTTAGQ